MGVKRNLKGYKLWNSKSKKIVLSRYVMFDEASMLRPNSQQMESMKSKEVSQRVEDDATSRSQVGSVSFVTSPDGDHVACLDVEHVEDHCSLGRS